MQVDGHSHHQQQQQQAQAQQAVDLSTRLYLEAVAEQLIARHTTEVGQAFFGWGWGWGVTQRAA